MSNPFSGNMNRCEAGGGKFREFDVVKPGHRDIFENPQSPVSKFAQDSESHEVIDTHNGGGPKSRDKQLARRLLPSFWTVLVRYRSPFTA